MTRDANSSEQNRQPNSRGCFVCGLGNPIGLKLVFQQDPQNGLIYTVFSVPDTYRSYPGVVHGGIVSTILDETSGRALMMHTGDENLFFVTAKMEVRYRRAAPTGTPLLAVGRVERAGPSRAWVQGELLLKGEAGPSETALDPDRTVLAECRSLVVRPQPEFLGGWDQEVPFWRVYSDEELASI
jgi:acyl-coenzyme A thioesterase PaaI-like protein